MDKAPTSAASSPKARTTEPGSPQSPAARDAVNQEGHPSPVEDVGSPSNASPGAVHQEPGSPAATTSAPASSPKAHAAAASREENTSPAAALMDTEAPPLPLDLNAAAEEGEEQAETTEAAAATALIPIIQEQQMHAWSEAGSIAQHTFSQLETLRMRAALKREEARVDARRRQDIAASAGVREVSATDENWDAPAPPTAEAQESGWDDDDPAEGQECLRHVEYDLRVVRPEDAGGKAAGKAVQLRLGALTPGFDVQAAAEAALLGAVGQEPAFLSFAGRVLPPFLPIHSAGVGDGDTLVLLAHAPVLPQEPSTILARAM
ncbi:unnamed protein product [Symbiodinium sp. CCMP2592]|nr:unnamed protein product [Symbiodinium sp. CCMP2592]